MSRLPQSCWMRCAIWRLSLWYQWTHQSTSASWNSWVKAHMAKWCWLYTGREVKRETSTFVTTFTYLKEKTYIDIFPLPSVSARYSNGLEVLPPWVHLSFLFLTGVQPLSFVLYPPIPDQSPGNCILYPFALCFRSASRPLWGSLWCHLTWGIQQVQKNYQVFRIGFYPVLYSLVNVGMCP